MFLVGNIESNFFKKKRLSLFLVYVNDLCKNLGLSDLLELLVRFLLNIIIFLGL